MLECFIRGEKVQAGLRKTYWQKRRSPPAPLNKLWRSLTGMTLEIASYRSMMP